MSGLPEVGERYGRYQISRLIGEDGGGVVYEATDTMLRRSVALTVAGHDRREAFGRESALRAGIRSRHVVTVLDHGTIDDTAYRTTEHFPDGDLATRLRTHGPMPRTDALAVTSQISAALADVHATGVVHAGLAPETILLRTDAAGPSPHLSDFSSAVPGRDDDRSDQHAVGVLLWTCLTGSAPAAAEPVPQLPATSAEDRAINGLLLRLLSPDPEDRFASMGELRAAVDRVATRGVSLTAAPSVTLPVAPVVAGETVRAEPTLFRSAEALGAEAEALGPNVPTPSEPEALASPAPAVAPALPSVAAAPPAPPKRRLPTSREPAGRWPWWVVAAVALVLILGGAAYGLTRGDGDADPRAASASPTPTAAGSPTPSRTSTPTPTPSAAVPSAPSKPKPKPAIGTLARSDAACSGTAGDYQKWAYALTGFTPGRTLHPQLAIRSDHGNGETTGKPVTVGPKGRGTGDFCVPTGTHGTVTITVAGTTAERHIG
ncbi:serine/threonine-protein kinase [Nocardioides nematodiphilus]|uniref:serine/threonine-protein kinase n=1 Tax=Nocardioides nematodiphilus TaxID=2849669 RepID=UPI001CD95943|nr:serine/threonine-protein kinase [Nocardioides nematodiphilus]MCA1983168.1 protein kinase [Nocardioides nematodiphilus]